METTQLKI